VIFDEVIVNGMHRKNLLLVKKKNPKIPREYVLLSLPRKVFPIKKENIS